MFSELPSPHTELKHGGRFCPIDHDYQRSRRSGFERAASWSLFMASPSKQRSTGLLAASFAAQGAGSPCSARSAITRKARAVVAAPICSQDQRFMGFSPRSPALRLSQVKVAGRHLALRWSSKTALAFINSQTSRDVMQNLAGRSLSWKP